METYVYVIGQYENEPRGSDKYLIWVRAAQDRVKWLR
jgi:hypothetical protein